MMIYDVYIDTHATNRRRVQRCCATLWKRAAQSNICAFKLPSHNRQSLSLLPSILVTVCAVCIDSAFPSMERIGIVLLSYPIGI